MGKSIDKDTNQNSNRVNKSVSVGAPTISPLLYTPSKQLASAITSLPPAITIISAKTSKADNGNNNSNNNNRDNSDINIAKRANDLLSKQGAYSNQFTMSQR